MATSSTAPGSCDVRDWAHLDTLAADQIAQYALSNGVVDLFSFGEVCKPWRACSDHLRRAQGVLDRRFQPRGWIVLPDASNDVGNRRRLMNAFTGKRIYVTVPDLHHVIGGTSEGLLVLGRTDTDSNIKLLNPITGQIISNLPPASTLVFDDDSGIREIELRGAGLADDSTVVLHFQSFSVAVAKPGDERWTHLYSTGPRILSTLPFAGRVYVATTTDISVVQTMANQRPQLVVAAAYELDPLSAANSVRKHFHGRSRMFLADNNGELIVCHHDCCDPRIHGSCYLYRVNLDTGKTVPLDGLNNGRAIFIITTRSVLVDSGVSLFICPDTVYLCAPMLVAFDLLGGCAERKFKKSDAANYLACYVSSQFVKLEE